LPGGVIAKRGQDPNVRAIGPGRSFDAVVDTPNVSVDISCIEPGKHMPRRVAEHRTNGRPFDQAFYIATLPNQREALERTLIKAIDPPQNRAHLSSLRLVPRHRAREASPFA
jgi:hypothetical protein